MTNIVKPEPGKNQKTPSSPLIGRSKNSYKTSKDYEMIYKRSQTWNHRRRLPVRKMTIVKEVRMSIRTTVITMDPAK